MQDRFTYEPKVLKPEDMVYVNSMILLMSKEIIGFNDFAAISDSIDFYLWSKTSMKNKEFLSLQTKEELIKFANDLIHDPMMKLSMICREKLSDEHQTCPLPLFRKVADNALLDFRTNKYIYWYLLSSEIQIRRCANLDFAGDADERIARFKEKYEELWGKSYAE